MAYNRSSNIVIFNDFLNLHASNKIFHELVIVQLEHIQTLNESGVQPCING